MARGADGDFRRAVSSTYGLNYVLMTVIAGLPYIGMTFIGVRGLHYNWADLYPAFRHTRPMGSRPRDEHDDLGRNRGISRQQRCGHHVHWASG